MNFQYRYSETGIRGEILKFFKIGLFCVILTTACSAVAEDVTDYTSFYNQYKQNVTPQNSLVLTEDVMATGNLYQPGSEVTEINGSGFNFNGNNYVGFILNSGQALSFLNGGDFSVSDLELSILNSYNSFRGVMNGSVIQNQGGNLTITDTAFSGNISSRRGGVINQTSGSLLTITNSAFQNNQAARDSGGAVSNDNQTDTKILNSYFDTNSSYRYGGAIFNDGTVLIEDSVFTSNTSGSGSAVYSSNQASLTNVIFEKNVSSSDIGAVYNSGQMEITEGIFTNNSGWDGGAVGNVGMLGDDMYLLIKDSTFTNNTAILDGGALFNNDVAYIFDSSFIDNSAAEGGAIFNMGTLNIVAWNKDVIFTGNTANNVSNALYTNGTVYLNAGEYSVIFNDKIQGSGQIIVNPDYNIENANVPRNGAIVLNEDMSGYTGSIEIQNGIVQVSDNGHFFNATDLTVEDGTLDIGATQAVVQNAIFQSGSKLSLTIQSASSYGSLKAETVTIDDGAILSALLQPDALGTEKKLQLPLIQSSQNFNDLFYPVIDNNLYEFISLGNGWYEISKVANYVDIVNQAGGDVNNINTANAWQTDPEEIGPAHDMYVELDTLAQNNSYNFVHALTAIAPSSAPLIQMLSYNFLDQLDNASESALENRKSYQLGNSVLWVSSMMNMQRLQKTSSYTSTHLNGRGISIGGEYIKKDLTFGLAYLYREDRIKNIFRSIRVPTHGVGLYATYDFSPWLWQGKLSYFYSRMKEVKNVVGYLVNNKISLETIGMQSDISYRLNFDSFDIIPQVGLQYAMVYRKSGQDSIEQTLRGKKLYFMTPYAKLNFEMVQPINANMDFRPFFEVGMSYDLFSSKDNALVQLPDDITYTVSAERLPRLEQEFSTGFVMDIDNRVEILLNIKAGFRKDYQEYMGYLKGVFYF